MFGTYFLIKDDKGALKRDICGNKSLFSNIRNPDPHKGNIKKFGIAMAHPITRNCFLSTNESNSLKIQCKLDSIDSIEKKQGAKQLSDRIRKSDIGNAVRDRNNRFKITLECQSTTACKLNRFAVTRISFMRPCPGNTLSEIVTNPACSNSTTSRFTALRSRCRRSEI